MKSIRIGNCTYIHVYLHDVDMTLEEACSQSDDSSKSPFIDFSESAKSLIDGMEDNWCVALLEAIKEECENRIHKHWERSAPEKNNKK